MHRKAVWVQKSSEGVFWLLTCTDVQRPEGMCLKLEAPGVEAVKGLPPLDAVTFDKLNFAGSTHSL